MPTTKKPDPRPLYFTPRQTEILKIACAMVSAIGYEILDQGDGEVARNIVRRAAQIVDAALAPGV